MLLGSTNIHPLSLIEYRKEHQQARDWREFDRYDPDTKRKDLPAQVSDEDPWLTLSGMQGFDREDLMYEKKKKLKQEQMRFVKFTIKATSYIRGDEWTWK